MDMQTASNLMHHLAGEHPGVESVPPDIEAWYEAMPLPVDLKRLLQWTWPTGRTLAGGVELLSPAAIRHSPFNMLPYKMLPIGEGPNADPFVVDWATPACNVGFVACASYDGQEDPRPYYQPVFRSLASFLYRVAEGLYVPVDYYDAKEFVAFLKAEEEHSRVPPFERKP